MMIYIANCVLSRFHVHLDGLDWVSNYEKTRWFLVLHVGKPEGDHLNRLLGLTNQTLGLFGQPPLYASGEGGGEDYSDCFHISIGWCLEEPSAADKERIQQSTRAFSSLDIYFLEVKAKIGNRVASVPLRAC